MAWPERERKPVEEIKELRSDGLRNSWFGLTPEQRQDRLDRAAATRAATKAAREEQYRREAARIAKRDARRQKAVQRAWETRDARLERRRELKRQQRERSSTPSQHRPVPGSKGKPYVFPGIPDRYLVKRSARFWPYVDTSGGTDACWAWHGPRRFESDYGQTTWMGQGIPAHRVAWMLHHGLDIPYDLVVDHLCGCRWCQNPDHLEPVTDGENKRRIHHRPPEATRTRTSFTPPWADRWYPFGRRLYDEDGVRFDTEVERDPEDYDERYDDVY